MLAALLAQFVMAGLFFSLIITNARLNVSVDELRQVLTTELPQLSEQSFQLIVAEMAKESPMEQVTGYLLVSAFAISLVVLAALAWRDFVLPFPRSLYFESTEEEPSNSGK